VRSIPSPIQGLSSVFHLSHLIDPG
jgi:hypothetical protein